jgi:hypothetical protein
LSARQIEFVRPWLYPKQLRAIFNPLDLHGNPARYSMIEASTKAGKTHGCICWLFEQAAIYGKPGRNYWWVAPVYRQAKIAFLRLKRACPKQLYHANNQDLQITLLNGAVIEFKSAEKPDNLYGDDVYAAVLDEASRMREEAWWAIRSTLTATNGPVRCIGNVKGQKNWFYKLSRMAAAGEPRMAHYKMTAYDAVEGGVLKLEEVEDAKRLLPEDVFRELYLAEPSDDGGNPFGLKHIANCVGPLSDERMVAAGQDLAKKQDWSVLVGLDRQQRVCGFDRWQKSWGETERHILDIVGNTPTLIDSTGVGDPIVERLQAKRPSSISGYVFSSASKQRLMEGLAVAIQSRAVTFPDGPIREELDNFEFQYTRTGVRYSAPVGFHDDCVMALALAVEQLRRISPALFGAGGPADLPRISPFTPDMSNNPYDDDEYVEDDNYG